MAWLAGPAWAAPECEPLDEPEFRSLVLDAQAAIDRGDVELPTALLDDFAARRPCLTFAPHPRLWADLLVAQAIVEFSRQGDWEHPMATALSIRPSIDRGVGSKHPLASWEPPPVPEPGPALAEGEELYVDGARTGREPPSAGLHLVQRTDGQFWNTLLLVDEPLPEGWAGARVDQPPRIAWWATAGALAGGGTVRQEPSWAPADFVADVPLDERLVLGAALDVALTFYSPFGLWITAMAPFAGDSPGIDGRLAGIWTYRRLTVGAGVGTHGVDVFYAEEQHRLEMLRYGLGTVHLRFGARPRWDVGLMAGGSAALVRTHLRVGGTLIETDSNRWRLGIDLTRSDATFQREGQPSDTVELGNTRAMLQIGLAWGEY